MSESTDQSKDELGFKKLPIEVLVKAEWNYKTQDEALQSKLVANIKKNGQIENILVRPLGDGTYEVTNGNHRLDALNTLEYKEVMVYDLGPISEDQAKRIAIETNETKFESDQIALAKIISGLLTTFEDFATTAPYTTEQLGNFDNLLAFDWDAADAAPEDAEEPEDESGNGKKTETVLSVGGEDFKVLKLELSTECADRFMLQLQRLQEQVGGGDQPINVICEMLEGTSDDSLDARPGKKKAAKKVHTD